MNRLWRDEDAVSPVIAVILMVAIAVVLAAVLYVMVSGMINTGSGVTPTIGMHWVEDLSNPGNYSGNVLRITGGDPPRQTHVTVVYTRGSETNAQLLDTIKTGDLVVASMTMTYLDNDGNNRLGAADTFNLDGVHEGDILRLVFTPTAGEMCSYTF